MTTTIRAYLPSDLDACRALWVDLTQRHRDIYEAPTIGGDDPGAQFDTHLAAVGPDNIWVAVDDDQIVGLTGLIQTGQDGEVEPVVVRPSYRGAGIGRQLCATVIDAARTRGVRHLSVRPVARNADAIAFFQGQGFDVVGHVELFMKLGSHPGGWTEVPATMFKGLRC